MNEWTLTPRFEEQVRRSFGVPEVRPEFVDQLYDELMQRAETKTLHPRRAYKMRPAWVITFAILALMLITTLVIGPQRVIAAVRQLFEYIPGVGIVEQGSSIRMLAEPVSQTRDGITVSVNNAYLTDEETRMDFGVSGVPLSYYPGNEAVTGCIEQPYLLLPDGSKIETSEAVPDDVDEATFVMSCIFNTLPGTTPEDWELALRFIDAPPDLTVLPVIDVTPQTSPTAAAPREDDVTPTAEETPNAQVTVDRFIETESGYILLGAVRPNIPDGSWLQTQGPATITDANGQKVDYTFPEDAQLLDDTVLKQGGTSWAMQIEGAGVTFPLTLTFSGVIISQLDPQAATRVTLDVGTAPQPDQVWEFDQEVQLAGKTLRLLSIKAGENSYSFHIDPGPMLSNVDVEIEGHSAISGGGGGSRQGKAFSTSRVYTELPTGQLTLLFSNPRSTGPVETWQTQWQPDTPRDFAPVEKSPDTCWDAASYPSIPDLPDGLDGKVVLTQVNPQMRIVLANMDGSRIQVLAEGSVRAALSQDSTRIAYSTDQGITIFDMTSVESATIPGRFGRDLHWSPDGQRIAFVNAGDAFGIFVLDINSGEQKQLTNLGVESIAGWSPQGNELYYAIPGSSADGFPLLAVDVESGSTRDVFILENSSRKAPYPALSPDGKWVAYRARDNSSLYLKNMDGCPARLLMDSPAMATSGIRWEREGHLLGVSLITTDNLNGEIILMAPDSCETYRLSGLSGSLDGVVIP